MTKKTKDYIMSVLFTNSMGGTSSSVTCASFQDCLELLHANWGDSQHRIEHITIKPAPMKREG